METVRFLWMIWTILKVTELVSEVPHPRVVLLNSSGVGLLVLYYQPLLQL